MDGGAFRPSRDGFAFPNTFSELGSGFGLASPLLPSFGLGAGMAWLALDRYLAGRRGSPAVEPPVPGDPLYAELVTRQANALAAATWSRLVEWQCLPERGLPGRPGLTELSRAHWRNARRTLDRGVPVLLFLVLVNGRHANPSANKAVLAVGYERDRRDRRVSILVYDPDRPGNDNVRLVFGAGRFKPLNARLGGDTQVCGFFSVPYDRAIPARLELDTAPVGGGRAGAVIGLFAGDRSDGPLTILARDRTARLVVARRDRRGHWADEGIATRTGGPFIAATDPHAVALVGTRQIVARAANGDLIELRRLPMLGWRQRMILESPRVEEDTRSVPEFTALRGDDGRLRVVACVHGALIQYRRTTLRGWKPERMGADPLGRFRFVGAPAVAELGDLHVVGRTESGDLVHLRQDRKAGWVTENITARPGGGSRFEVADDPILLPDRAGRRLNAVTRCRDGSIVLFRWTEERGWRGTDLASAVRAAGREIPAAESRVSAAIDHDGTVHAAARDAHGGLVHLWGARGGATGGDVVTRTRAAIGAHGRIEGNPLIAAGPAASLHVFAPQGNELLLFRWTPVADWTVENVSRERRAWDMVAMASEAVLLSTDDIVHVAFADAAGSLQCACVASAPPRRIAASGVRTGERVRPTQVDAAASTATPHRAARTLRETTVSAAKAPVTVPAAPPSSSDTVAASPAPLSPSDTAAAPKSSTPPALEGLPLLTEEESVTTGGALPLSRPAAARLAAERQRNREHERNRRELQRILVLADEQPPRLLDPN